MIPILDSKRQYATIGSEVEKAVCEVLRSGSYILGPNAKAFEQEMADFIGCKYTVGLNSGTDALHLALRALNIGAGDEVITVADDDLIGAFLDVVENHKMIVENSGLLTVAALKQLNVKDKRIVSILSGGNMDVITMSSVVQQGLILRDRIFTVSVLLPDKPGELCRVSGIIAGVNGNVIKLEHNQFVTTNRSAAVELRITLESFGTEHKKQIMKALEKKGYKPKLVRTSL